MLYHKLVPETESSRKEPPEDNLLSDDQATAEALGPFSLGGEERNGMASAMGADLGPKDGILYPQAQNTNSDARAGGQASNTSECKMLAVRDKEG